MLTEWMIPPTCQRITLNGLGRCHFVCTRTAGSSCMLAYGRACLSTLNPNTTCFGSVSPFYLQSFGMVRSSCMVIRQQLLAHRMREPIASILILEPASVDLSQRRHSATTKLARCSL